MKKKRNFFFSLGNDKYMVKQNKQIEEGYHEKLTTAKKIKDSAYRPVALGIFGASQCGKSYLTSELVRGNDKALSVLVSNFGQQPEARDYLEEINPAGGRESTAIVTRFTIRPYQIIPNCAAFIRLLNITSSQDFKEQWLMLFFQSPNKVNLEQLNDFD